jgi:hypothetical protein
MKPQIEDVLSDLGLRERVLDSLFDFAFGGSSREPQFGGVVVEHEALVYSGSPKVRLHRVPTQSLPRVSGSVFVSGGLLDSYDIEGVPATESYDSDFHQMLLAVVKTVVSDYSRRVRSADTSISPHPLGVDPVVGWFIVTVVLVVLGATLTGLCAAKSIPKSTCDALLPVVTAAANAAVIKTCTEINKGKGGSCNLKSNQSLP